MPPGRACPVKPLRSIGSVVALAYYAAANIGTSSNRNGSCLPTFIRSRATAHGALLLTLLAAAIVWFGALGYRALADPDEGRYAEIPREMVASGDWLTPRVNDIKYLTSPRCNIGQPLWRLQRLVSMNGPCAYGRR